MTDAEFALFHLQRVLWDPIDPTQLGSLQPDLHFRVNGEVYRFGNERTLERFAQDPVLWCGLLRDPVTGNRFLPSARSPEAYWVGGPYFFQSDSTKQVFVDQPFQYEVKRTL